MSTLSVIIPIYKTPKDLLTRMFVSVQGLPADTEIVCVIDSPGDPCEAVVNEFAANDSRIVVLRNDQNMGETWSRNRALDAISGEFFTCVDADDVIKPEAYVKALKVLKENQYDFCSLGMAGGCKCTDLDYGDVTFDFDTVVLQVEMSACGIVVRTDKVRQFGLHFPNGLSNNGDYVFATRLLWSGMRYCAIKDIGYCVVGHPDSSSRISYGAKQARSTAKALRMITEVLQGRELSNALIRRYAHTALFYQMINVNCIDYPAVATSQPYEDYLTDQKISAGAMRGIFKGRLNPIIDYALFRISKNPMWLLEHYRLFLFFLRTGIVKSDIGPQIRKMLKRIHV